MKIHEARWFHVDMDAFYASIEQRDRPEYKNRPVIIGAMPGTRGVVATCSYEARVYGVHSAMPISEAFRLCPEGVYIPPRIDYYSEISKQIFTILQDFSPEIIPISIDEAFINMTGTEGIWGRAENAVRLLKERVLATHALTLSVGVAANRLVAKMASAFRKPDGLTIVAHGEEEAFVEQLSLNALWGVGKKTRQHLGDLNVSTITELKQIPQDTLQKFFGTAGGNWLFQVIRGIDPGIYNDRPKKHSISNEHTFPHDCRNSQQINDVLFNLAYGIVFRMHYENSSSHTLVLKFRLGDFSTSTIQKTIGHSIRTVEECYELAIQLLKQKWDGRSPVRLIGLALSGVEKIERGAQADLFDFTDGRRYRIETAVIELHKKYRNLKLAKARTFVTAKTDQPHGDQPPPQHQTQPHGDQP